MQSPGHALKLSTLMKSGKCYWIASLFSDEDIPVLFFSISHVSLSSQYVLSRSPSCQNPIVLEH